MRPLTPSAPSPRLWALAAVAAALALGCLRPGPGQGAFCEVDADCPPSEVCFANGCGDPGRDIAVEVLPSAQGARFPQDFAIELLKGTQVLQLRQPPSILGELKQQAEPPATGTLPYTGPIAVSITGRSAIIPGIVRRYQSTFSSTSAFSVSVGSGDYTVTVTAEDQRLPPVSVANVKAVPGQDVSARFVFPAFGHLRSLSGMVVHSVTTSSPVDAVLEVQAIDPVTQEALSQRVFTGANGVFRTHIARNPDPAANVMLRVRPRDPHAYIPQKDFLVSAAGSDNLVLEIGTFGSPVTVQGHVTTAAGKAVPGAAVYLRGTVSGGGTYRSATTTTSELGFFTLKTLPSAPGTRHAVWISPAAESGSSLLRAERAVSSGSSQDLGTFTLRDKLMVRGTVSRPEPSSTALAGVRVKAEPVDALPGAPLPTFGGAAETDSTGQYVLRLDPGIYRLDFFPPAAEGYPRSSRFFRADPAARTTSGLVEVPPVSLSHGRIAQGEITLFNKSSGGYDPAPLSSVRFFRVVVLDGKRASILLGEAISDGEGKFSVMMPTRSQDLRLVSR